MMMVALIVIQVVTLGVVVALVMRRPAPGVVDPALAQLVGADLPARMARLDVRFEGLETHLRAEVSGLREDTAREAVRTREAAEAASTALRREVVGSVQTLGTGLMTGLEGFRVENARAANEGREALHARLVELRTEQGSHQENLRKIVEQRLDALNASNAAKLEEMRATVDEKLHATLQTRLTESFGVVTEQLTRVHAGLGEMTKLSAGVNDLSRIFTNVKSRGTVGEVMLETLLKQMLAPGQYVQNAKVRPNTQEMVEFAVKLPTPNGETLLPIDSKFPREIWERLETAYETGTGLESAGKAFEAAIRFEGKKICEKYISPPVTTSFALMFLPTESLYAEVMRRDGLQADIQQNCRVTIAGPSTLSAILSSYQMGFHMLQMQEKGDEVWKVLAAAKNEFEKFEGLVGSMEKQVGTVQNTIEKLGTRTRAINRTLRDVSVGEESLPSAAGGFDGFLPQLSAGEDV